MQIFFQNEKKNSSDLFRAIEQVCDGLIYVSEADAPVVAFAGPQTDTVSANVILRHAELAADSVVEEKDLGELFGRLTAKREWHREADTARAQKFLELQELLEENLRDLKVIRFGYRRLNIFVVGIDKNGRLMDVTTTAVET